MHVMTLKPIRYTIIAALLLILATVWSPARSQTAPTGSLTLATQVNSDSTLTPTLTWTTTPAATSCTASGDAAWTGTKAASGTQTLAKFPTSTPKTYALLCTWPGQTSVVLTWVPPTQNTDGTPLTNLAGYRILHGRAANSLTSTIEIANPATRTYTIENLQAGANYFAVRAYTSQGAESVNSNLASVTLSGGVEWSQSTGVKVPAAPALTVE